MIIVFILKTARNYIVEKTVPGGGCAYTVSTKYVLRTYFVGGTWYVCKLQLLSSVVLMKNEQREM